MLQILKKIFLLGTVFLLASCSDKHILSHGDYTYDSVILYQNDFIEEGEDVYLHGFLHVEREYKLVRLYPTREDYLIKNLATEFLIDMPFQKLESCAGSYVIVIGKLKINEHGFKTITEPLVEYFPFVHKIGDGHKPLIPVPVDDSASRRVTCYEISRGESYPPESP